jgi:hypothetical protein
LSAVIDVPRGKGHIILMSPAVMEMAPPPTHGGL